MMRTLVLLAVIDFSISARYNFEITSFTGKSFSPEFVDDLEVSFNKTRYNVTGFVKVPLSDIFVSFLHKMETYIF